MMHACMQIVATLVKLLLHDMSGYICSNYVFIQERTHYSDDFTNSALHVFTPLTGMCSPRKCQITPSQSAFRQFIIELLQHKMCLHPQFPTYRFMDSSSTYWLHAC